MDNQNKIVVRTFAAALAGAVSESLGKAAGSPWPLEVVDTDQPPARRGQPLQFSLKLDGGLRGQCFIEFYQPAASELASKLAGQPVETVGDEHIKSLVAALSASTAALNESLAARYGQLSCKVEAISGLAFGGMYVVSLAPPTAPADATVLLYFDGQLLDALAAAAEPQDADAGKHAFHPSNLKLVMDVELNVSLRFGQRQLPLRDVLDLGSGSVVELDRLVDEPVELLLDGKLVARGEAVIVDGNYGLRVTEIPQAVETHFLR
ncbi:MAG TPA: flagellar motor switch protein FliN [Terracidiphilus sp.]|jgi:flagellar motor switch protein FliN/FliY|nr:flagellar motor switch protein FliN [Terracidiphilus sp.]